KCLSSQIQTGLTVPQKTPPYRKRNTNCHFDLWKKILFCTYNQNDNRCILYNIRKQLFNTHLFQVAAPPLLYDKAAVKIRLAKAGFFVVIAPSATKGGFPFNDTSA